MACLLLVGVMNAFLGMVIVLVWFSCFDGLVA